MTDILIEKTLIDTCTNELRDYADTFYGKDEGTYDYLWGLIDRICQETSEEKNNADKE